jgi:hypothetical protein
VLGEPLVVQGAYRNATGGAVQLRLAGFGKGLDSVTVAPGATARFALRTIPKETGPFVFYLESAAGPRRLGAEKIPFEVTPKRRLNVLFLESFPTFGGKFLKAFLSEAGHRVAARAAISKGKFRTEFLNAPPAALGRLTPALLAGLDLLILDDASLRDLGGAERGLLRGAIRDGLGVLVWASGGTLPGGAPFTAFRLAAVPGPEERRLAPRWTGGPADVPPIAFPSLAVENTPAVRPLVETGKGSVVAAYAPYGLGGVTVAVASNAFEWVLAGRAPVHASYWSHLLTATARRREVSEGWRVATPLPVPDGPATLQLVSAGAQLPALTVDSTTVYPQQTAAGLGGWESTFWPRREGWHAATDGCRGAVPLVRVRQERLAGFAGPAPLPRHAGLPGARRWGRFGSRNGGPGCPAGSGADGVVLRAVSAEHGVFVGRAKTLRKFAEELCSCPARVHKT